MNKYNTKQKEILTLFFKNNKDSQFSVNEIAERICNEYNIGKSTVYRIVSELVSEGKLRRLSDGKTRHCTYQYIGDDECSSHLHLKCRDCGRLIHLEDEISHEFAAALLSLDGFTLDAGAMLFGKCKDCKTGDSIDSPKEHICHKAHRH